jgi:hypothetical protein
MNQWVVASLILWLGTGALIVANNFANVLKEKYKRSR